jgi:hypothetical protein
MLQNPGMSKINPGNKPPNVAQPLKTGSAKDEKSLRASNAKAPDPIPEAAPSASRAPQPKGPKDGTDGSIVLRPERTGSQ